MPGSLIFTIFVVAELFKTDTLDRSAGPAGAVYALSALLVRSPRDSTNRYVWQSYAQIAVDLLLITWIVNRTGGVDSYFSSLYFLEIVMSSILLERRGAFLAGTASSVIHFAHMDLGYFRLHTIHDERLARSVIVAVHHQPQYFRLLLGCFSLELPGGKLATHGVELQRSTGRSRFSRRSATASWTVSVRD